MISRRQFLARAAASGGLLVLPQLSSTPRKALIMVADAAAKAGESIVVSWNQAALQGVRDSKLGPPMVARALAIVHSSPMATASAIRSPSRPAVPGQSREQFPRRTLRSTGRPLRTLPTRQACHAVTAGSTLSRATLMLEARVGTSLGKHGLRRRGTSRDRNEEKSSKSVH